jgi:gag-polypeptide of LTR copia-type
VLTKQLSHSQLSAPSLTSQSNAIFSSPAVVRQQAYCYDRIDHRVNRSSTSFSTAFRPKLSRQLRALPLFLTTLYTDTAYVRIFSSTDIQRSKQAILNGKDNWATWSTGFLIYLSGKGTDDTITKPAPIDPSTVDDNVKTALIRDWILDYEEIEEDKITPQKIASNKRKVTRILQEKYDEWNQRNKTTISDIYHACNSNVQSLIGKYSTASALWSFLEKAYSASGVAAIDSKLCKLRDLSYTNTKSAAHLISTIRKSKETLIALGAGFHDVFFVHVLLQGLGPSFSSLARDI